MTPMALNRLLTAIDEEIKRLEQARRVLAGAMAAGKKANSAQKAGGRKPRRLSAEGRARIVAAQRKRWAARNKASKKK
jgi:hypothetical protein